MNLILFKKQELADHTLVLTDRRCLHINKVLRSKKGECLRVGEINGRIGEGVVDEISDDRVTLQVELKDDPPKPSLASLIVALPRPKSLPRVIQTLTSLGVKKITFVNSYRVEKFFWSSDYLSEESVDKNILLGLEQSVDTLLPEVSFRRRFKPFVEDELPVLLEGKRGYVAHPYAAEECPVNLKEEVLVAVGPEGGWIDFEVDLLESLGVTPVRLSPRILRLENALTSLVSRITTLC